MNTYQEVLEKYTELCTREETCDYDDQSEFFEWLEKKVAEQTSEPDVEICECTDIIKYYANMDNNGNCKDCGSQKF